MASTHGQKRKQNFFRQYWASRETGEVLRKVENREKEERAKRRANFLRLELQNGRPVMPGALWCVHVTSGSTDHLFASLRKSARDTSWTSSTKWRAYPFHAVGEPRKSVSVASIAFAVMQGGRRHIFVDIDCEAGYHVDPSRETGR
ncbi:hypothetical protein B0T26DRAFT_679803 [Lasiosphaeria miniovina]|uniref:Uncharacterized protein n=1 Tax=Lasiosphaeria miniovina TaxID=1954250 RepID=A0AA39ZYQ8_9PEZI|nr:uncharacterized protein B0T26DRAFT_679803 [Lasiosphaeria miniovina]KAK0706073.1 hypothetical protein B0T26DRAFT_679803 [Lasiosphaeria miniovina]